MKTQALSNAVIEDEITCTEGEVRQIHHKRNKLKVAVYEDTHPGRKTPRLKMNLGKCWGNYCFFPVLMLFLRHPFTAVCWTDYDDLLVWPSIILISAN